MLYLEDFAAGDARDLGECTVTREEIIAFARQFDPQPFHLDQEAAERSIYGGLIASGWHTASLCMRLIVDGMLKDVASMGSPGVDELRWLKPVRPGDRLRLHVEVLEVRGSTSKPDRGSIRLSYTLTDPQGATVLTMKSTGILARRPSA